MDIRTEIPQGNQRPRSGIHHVVASFARCGGDKQFIVSHFAEADQRWRGDVVGAHPALPLHSDPTAGA